MSFATTDIPGLLVFQPLVLEDTRGYFFESYNENIFRKEGLNFHWVQDNQSLSSYGVIRGLHFQNNPHAQAKLVRVLEGRIWDVAVDIRKGSPFYGKSFGIELNADNRLQMLIPKGFAHGFSVLSENAVVLYKCDKNYDKASERGIMYNDPALNIDWKIPAGDIILSEKDQHHPGLKDCNHDFVFEDQ